MKGYESYGTSKGELKQLAVISYERDMDNQAMNVCNMCLEWNKSWNEDLYILYTHIL